MHRQGEGEDTSWHEQEWSSGLRSQKQWSEMGKWLTSSSTKSRGRSYHQRCGEWCDASLKERRGQGLVKKPPTSSNGAQWAKGSGETWFKLRSGTWRRIVWPAKVKDNEVWTMEAGTFSYLLPALIPLRHSANTNKPAQEGTAGGPLLVL